jgi:hypothetical protein
MLLFCVVGGTKKKKKHADEKPNKKTLKTAKSRHSWCVGVVMRCCYCWVRRGGKEAAACGSGALDEGKTKGPVGGGGEDG